MADILTTSLFLDQLDALGVTPPTAALLARDMHQAALTAATADPSDHLHASLAAGEVTLDNVAEKVMAAALDATVKAKAREIIRDMEGRLARHAGQAIRDDGDRLLKELGRTFAKAAKAAQTAGRLFPDTATPEQVLEAGTEAAEAWRGLHESVRTLEACRAVRMRLAHDYAIAPAEPAVLLFTRGITSQLGLEQAVGAWNGTDLGRWHALTAAGFELHLASATDIATAKASIAAKAQAEDDARRQAAAAKAAEGWMWPAMPTRTPAA